MGDYRMDLFSELKNYSPTAILGMGCSFLWTKLFFRGADLIRKPLYLRGKKRNFHYGHGFRTGRRCRIELFGDGVIRLGERCHIGDFVHIASSSLVEVGDDCLFASKIFISDTSHGSYGEGGSSPDTPPELRPLVSDPVKIGKNVWLGDSVVILPGVTVGDGCVIGANAVVTKDIPAYTVAGGCPARPLKQYDFDAREWKRI